MLRTTKLYILLLSSLLILISACKDKANADIQSFIPADAPGVLIIDVDNLADKLDMAKARKNMFVSILELQLQQQGIPNFIKDRKVTGLDLSENIYIILPGAGSDSAILRMVTKIDDREQFEEFIGAATQQAKLTEESDVKFISQSNFFVAWKDDIAVFATGEVREAQKKAAVLSLFNREKDASLFAANERFSALAAENLDIALWLDNEKLQAYASAETGMTNDMQELQKDAESTLKLDFENGQIHIAGTGYFNENAARYFSENMNEGFDESLLNFIPDQNIIAFVSIAMNPQMIRDMMSNMNPMANRGSGQPKKLISELMKAMQMMKGHGFFAFTGMRANISDTNDESAKPVFFGVVNTADNAEDSLRGMLDTILIRKNDYLATPKDEFFVALRNGKGFISNDQDYLARMMNSGTDGTGFEVTKEVRSMARTYPFALYVDVEKLTANINTSGNEEMASISRMIENHISAVEITVNKMNGDKMSGDMYIRMKNKDVSSLQALVDMALAISSSEEMQPF